jgi:hypothetical protein
MLIVGELTNASRSISLEEECYDKLLPVLGGSKSKVVALCMAVRAALFTCGRTMYTIPLKSIEKRADGL